MEDYATLLKLRIDWSELDFFGHVNNLAIMKYVQSARVHLLEGTGLMKLYSQAKKGPIMASVKCQFKKTLFFPGEVFVYSKVEVIKNTSFEIVHSVYNEKAEVIAHANDILVFYDFINDTKLPIPADIREQLEKLRGKG